MKFWLCLLLMMFTSCLESSPNNELSFQVFEVKPTSSLPGEVISLSGVGFGIQGIEDQVTLSGEVLEVLYWSAERVDVRIPLAIQPGAKVLLISASRRVSSPLNFEVLERPIYLASDTGFDAEIDFALDAEVDLSIFPID